MTLPDLEQVEVTSQAALWAWLETHHSQDASVLLVTWKKAAGETYVGRDAVLDALIAYGWIDGREINTKGSYPTSSSDGKYFDTNGDGWWDMSKNDGTVQRCEEFGCEVQSTQNQKQ